MDASELIDGLKDGRGATSGWEMVTLGIVVPRSHFCICCLAFQGPGMTRNGISYCLACWDRRQQGEPCNHKSNPREVSWPKAV